MRFFAKMRQGAHEAGRSIGYYAVLAIPLIILLSLGWWWLSSTLSNLLPNFGWPEWMHWPHWFSDTAAATAPTPVETVATATAPDGSCDGWGYKSWCWKN